ncbi:Alpha/Beta hydrolase protein [Zychaea mexicana]|uniref:Alpha/Beta hydrolase protein n=1 Tax=Zychaea mexicana TaxID=64656 RepID=UPI0022FEBB80|nr:Alpha/Beta hydrolase protein [Zychaea mexicana]KAI9497378.1 Alpha/Beta hydrolase protein [Zychaea mexicana]
MKLFTTLAVASCLVLPFVSAGPVFLKRQSDENRMATSEEVENLKYYMTLAGNAYCPTVIPGGQWDCGNCDRTANMEIVEVFTTPEHDTNAMVVRDDERKRIISVFREVTISTTSNNSNIQWSELTNNNYLGTYQFKGFYQSYEEVAEQIVSVVEQQVQEYPDYSLTSTGHSLGGCTSTLHALDLHQRGYNVTLYSHAAPRIGNRAFVEYAASTGIPYYRLTNKRDLFVDFPSRLLGYVHGGTEYWINSRDEIEVCPNGPETNGCYDSGFGIKNIDDHLQ